MNITPKYIYFIGAGGIGMSALARYFNAIGLDVAGYDLTPTPLTLELINEGIDIHFEDNVNIIPEKFKAVKNRNEILVIYTPAIPKDHKELDYYIKNNFAIRKRSQILGLIANSKKGIAIAGTHGKTTVSTMIAHILKNSTVDCGAFLGGISLNYNSNLLIPEIDNNGNTKSDYVVIEADEFDRSFLQLYPYLAVITTVDADHLDIYGSSEELKKTFSKFTTQITNNGYLIIKEGIQIENNFKNYKHTKYYALESKSADYSATNIRIENDLYLFDFTDKADTKIKDIKLSMPGLINVENAIAAISVVRTLCVSDIEIKNALKNFKGIKRRFNIYKFENNDTIYIDDYAHHPEELRAAINSVRKLYPTRKISGIFQPHLYSRTKDFASEFAKSLSLLDELILLNIYPARELQIEGVTSEVIYNMVSIENKILCKKNDLLNKIKNKNFDVLMTLGAGDIDTFVEPIKKLITKYNIKK